MGGSARCAHGDTTTLTRTLTRSWYFLVRQHAYLAPPTPLTLTLPLPSSDAQMELLDGDEDATAAKEAQQEKVRAALEGLWAKYDADGNGELSGDELELLMKGYFENAEEVRILLCS